jgi:hypothetical protein
LEENKEANILLPVRLVCGHYKSVVNNDELSEMHAVFVDVVVNSGYSPNQWQWHLTVMLEKKQGVIFLNNKL